MAERAEGGDGVKDLLQKSPSERTQGESTFQHKLEQFNPGIVWLDAEREPDDTATAVYEGVWFSSETVGTDRDGDAPPGTP